MWDCMARVPGIASVPDIASVPEIARVPLSTLLFVVEAFLGRFSAIRPSSFEARLTILGPFHAALTSPRLNCDGSFLFIYICSNTAEKKTHFCYTRRCSFSSVSRSLECPTFCKIEIGTSNANLLLLILPHCKQWTASEARVEENVSKLSAHNTLVECEELFEHKKKKLAEGGI